MTITDILKYRLHNQQIARHAFENPGDVVKWLGAVQAQDYLNSLWAIGLRLKNADESDIEKAIADKTIVRTWPMRGTLHFVAPEDIRWMLKLLTSRIIARAATKQDLAWWSGLTVTEAKKGLEMVSTHFNKEVIQDQTYWMLNDMPVIKT